MQKLKTKEGKDAFNDAYLSLQDIESRFPLDLNLTLSKLAEIHSDYMHKNKRLTQFRE